MDQSTLVENQIDDGRRFVEQFAADGNPVQAAFWVKTAEEGLWFLYVVTEVVDREGPAAAYRYVHVSLKRLRESWVFSSDVKVIGPNNPIARDVLAVMMTHSQGRLATRFGGKNLGLMAVEQTYIYPPHLFTTALVNRMTPEDVSREILRLMNRSAGMVVQPSRITLNDGTTFSGIPISLQRNQQAVVVQFMEDRGDSPRAVRLDEIASIA